VKKAFSERRKMLRNTLQPLYTSQQVGRRVALCARDLCRPVPACPPTLFAAATLPTLQIEAALTAISMRSDARAQDLTTDQFAALYSRLHTAVTAALE
jgi:16S rRNA A1518/A1519 N6-dimethyltransferase RsmA/KsgA/DIM1 with predicted DNA glycosylase/AP lyase activity